jgi:transcriptional regulator with XRE-family HTH domain
VSNLNKEITGERIKEQRKSKKMTQKQLSKILNKSESSIQKYESGDVEIPHSVVEEIAQALDTTVIYLLGYDDNKLDEELADMFEAIESQDPELKLFNDQLKQLGCYIQSANFSGYDIKQPFQLLSYNNNAAKIPTYELETLRKSFKAYMQFMLQELLKKY